MRRFVKFAVVLLAVTMVVAGGCKRNEGRPFTRHMNRPAYNGPFSVASPTPAPQPQTTTGKILYVPSQYPTIKEAVQHATANDVVELAPGTHSVDETIEWSDFTISGSSAERTEVTWDSTSSGTVFCPKNFSSIQNLTIRRGSSTIGSLVGIRCLNVHDVTISGINIEYIDDGMDLVNSDNILLTDIMTIGCWNVVRVLDCDNVTLRRNSFFRGHDIVDVIQSTNVTSEENIISSFDGKAIKYDNISEPTLRSIRNNVWSDNATQYYWNTSTNYSSTLRRGSDFTDNPVMINSNWGDIRLSPLSPCMTSGLGGTRIGSWRHPQAPAYKTDVQAALDVSSPSGTVFQAGSTDVMVIDLIADATGPVTFVRWNSSFNFEIITTSGNTLTHAGTVSLVDLDTGTTIASWYSQYIYTTYALYMDQTIIIPAGTMKRLALRIDNGMISPGTPFQATLQKFTWSDGRILNISDGRVSPIVGHIVQF